MEPQSLLVANRGEIAIRVMRAAASRGLRSVAVYSEDEAGALHTHKADAAQPLHGTGAAAYLDIGGILAAARAASSEVGPEVPSSTGIPQRCASERARALSPKHSSASGLGPTKVSPADAQRRASSALSDRKP